MLSNIKKSAISAYQLVKKPIGILFSPITVVVNAIRRLADYRYFDPVEKDNLLSGERPLIENNKICRYAPDKVFEEAKLQENELIFKGRRFPLKKIERSVDGLVLYSINLGNHHKDFGLSDNESKQQELVIAVDDNGNLVNPVKGLEGKKRNIKVEEKNVKLLPYSFAVKNKESNNLWILSLALLPLNLGGSVIGLAGRLAAGILDKIGGAIQNLSNNMLKSNKTALVNEKEGILKSDNNHNKVSAVLSAVFGIVVSIFLTSSSVIRESSEFTEAVMRTPTSFLNALINNDGVSFKAGVGALKRPLVNFYGDMKSVGNNFVNNMEQSHKVFTGDVVKEDSKMANNHQHSDYKVDFDNNDKQINNTIKSRVGEIGRDLSESGMSKSTLPERRIGSENQLKQVGCSNDTSVQKKSVGQVR